MDTSPPPFCSMACARFRTAEGPDHDDAYFGMQRSYLGQQSHVTKTWFLGRLLTAVTEIATLILCRRISVRTSP